MFNKNKVLISIEGIHCEHCSKRVEEALSNLDDIKNVKVNLKESSAKITPKNTNIDLKRVEEVIDELGYEYKGIIK